MVGAAVRKPRTKTAVGAARIRSMQLESYATCLQNEFVLQHCTVDFVMIFSAYGKASRNRTRRSHNNLLDCRRSICILYSVSDWLKQAYRWEGSHFVDILSVKFITFQYTLGLCGSDIDASQLNPSTDPSVKLMKQKPNRKPVSIRVRLSRI